MYVGQPVRSQRSQQTTPRPTSISTNGVSTTPPPAGSSTKTRPRTAATGIALRGQRPDQLPRPHRPHVGGQSAEYLYGPFDAYAGGYSGGKITQENTSLRNLNTNLLGSPTLNYNSASSAYAYGPVNTSAPSRNNSGITTLPVYIPSGPVSNSSRLVREITPGSPIVPRDIRDLPGVSQALNNPNQFIVGNHSNQGYNVLGPDGSVRYVTGGDYLPITEQARRSQIEGNSAAGRAMFLTGIQEAMVMASPIHDTGRDASVFLTGRDYLVDPSVRYSPEDQVNAGKMLFLPGENSGQAKHANDVIGSLTGVHKNSLQYVGDTHVYRIIAPDGSTHKIGESAQGVRLRDGASIRAEEQVRDLNDLYGPGYRSQIRQRFTDKQSSVDYQTDLIERFRQFYGPDALPGNNSNR